MNKRQKTVQNVHLSNERAVIKELKKNYESALEEVREKIQYLYGAEPVPTQSKIYQIRYQEALEKQLSSILDLMDSNNFTSVNEYLEKCYEDGFIGTLYDLQGQGVPLIFPFDQSEVVSMISKSGDDIKISTRLYKNTKDLKSKIKNEVSRGISTGASYSEIARNLSLVSEANYNKAVRIARTEGHRVREGAAYSAQMKAKDKGADVVKQWDSTLDSKTRESHTRLNGQIKELEDPYVIDGNEAMLPGHFGIPSEDINCRCCSLQRARWALDDEEYTKMNGDTNELVRLKEKDYNKFKKAYYNRTLTIDEQYAINQYVSSESYKINEKLRTESDLSEVDKQLIKKLDNALSKMSNYNGNVIRTLQINNEKQMNKFIDRNKVGSTTTWDEYLSFSNKANYNDNANVFIYVDSKNGKDIRSFNPSEGEILYQRNSKFNTVNLVISENKVYILWEEVNE